MQSSYRCRASGSLPEIFWLRGASVLKYYLRGLGLNMDMVSPSIRKKHVEGAKARLNSLKSPDLRLISGSEALHINA